MNEQELRGALREYIERHRTELLDDLAAVVAIPSVARPGADGLPLYQVFIKQCFLRQ